MLLLGIDIGTTNSKVALYQADGSLADHRTFPTPVSRKDNGWTEYSADQLWQGVSRAIRQMAKTGNRGQDVVSVAVSSQGESGLLVDESNRPLTDIIAWHDTRTKTVMEEWKRRIPVEELYRITGLELNYIYSLLKIEWLKLYRPDVYSHADKWHCISDYLTRRFSGQAVMDESLASRTMAFDIRTKTWSTTLLELAGISGSLLPDTKPSGSRVGNILPDVAEELGLHTDVTVATGGFDHMCGCMGIGAVLSDDIVASIGTTESVCLQRDRLETGNSYSGYLWGCHVVADQYYQIGGMPAGGQTIEWAIKTIASGGEGNDGFDVFQDLFNRSSPGSRGVIFLPHLDGCVSPIVNPDAKGAFWGISMNTRKEDLARAVIEGLCYEFRFILEQAGGRKAEAVLAMGGGTKNASWMQCKADVLNLHVIVTDIEDSVTWGAALLGGIAAGGWKGQIPMNAQQKKKTVYLPDTEKNKLYEKIYQDVYKKLYHSQTKILESLRNIVN